MNWKILNATVAAGLVVFGGIGVSAQDKSGSSDRMTNHEMASMSADSHWVTKAAQGGVAEVEFGNLAKDRASSDAVKSFAQQMIDDHTNANDELKALAGQKNITLPADIDPKDKAVMDKLSKLNGAAFDKAYMRDMVADHKKDVAEFQKEVNSGKDPDVKAWAAKTLPTLQHHLQMAQQIEHKSIN